MLHRDIYWLGRQWAVTGFGVQMVDKRHRMQFDVNVSRIWDDSLEQQLSAEPWFDAEDFRAAVDVARVRASQSSLTFQMPPGDER